MNYYDKNIIEIHNDLINKKVTSKELIDFSKNKILETSEKFSFKEVAKIVNRLAGNIYLDLQVVKQDKHLSKNQNGKLMVTY